MGCSNAVSQDISSVRLGILGNVVGYMSYDVTWFLKEYGFY
jgi:hypothetical protein